MKIKIHDIEFRYNGAPILKHVTGHIKKGDFVALVGPNGSGKSTLMKCINGILKTQKGVVMLDDKTIDEYTSDEIAREVAYVPQSENKQTALTVFDTVLLGRKPYINWKPSGSDLKVTAEVLKTLHLDDIAMKEVNKLSGGQQQCVYIARALAQEPEVLLLDEPTANLDMKHQMEVMELLKRLSEQGITIIIALHDINTAVRYASGILMLKDGSIFSNGGRETITAENIGKLYDIKVHIIHDHDNLYIVPNGLPDRM